MATSFVGFVVVFLQLIIQTADVSLVISIGDEDAGGGSRGLSSLNPLKRKSNASSS